MRVALISAILMLVALESRADWQYTRWGMSLEELMALPGVSVSLAMPSERENADRVTGGRAEATAPYQAGPLKLNAYFLFARNHLTMVRLQTMGHDADLLISRISEAYGPAETTNNIDNGSCSRKTMKYRDRDRGNLIGAVLSRCRNIDSTVGTVDYRPLSRGEL